MTKFSFKPPNKVDNWGLINGKLIAKMLFDNSFSNVLKRMTNLIKMSLKSKIKICFLGSDR